MVERRLGDLLVRDRQLERVAELLELVEVQLLLLVRHVACLGAGAERPALHRLGEDHRRPPSGRDGRRVRGIDLLVVVAAALEVLQVRVGEVLDHLCQARIGAEEVLAHVGAVLHLVLLPVAVDRFVEPVDQHAVDVLGEQLVPLAAEDHLDDVPAGARERGLQLLDDLAVAAHRPVEALQVAVDDERQVVEPLARRETNRAGRLGLVGLAVAEERPHARVAGVGEATRMQVAVEARLVDGVERPQAHADRGELPELGHEARVWVAREALAAHDFLAEVIDLRVAEPALEVGARVDAGRCVTLVEDLVAAAARILAAEEVVEADLVQRGRGGVRREVAAEARVRVVRAHDHGRGVPADDAADALLHRLVAGERRLLLGGDRVDVARLDEAGQADVELARALEHAAQQEVRALAAVLPDDVLQRVEPVLRLTRVGVGQLALEAGQHVEDEALALAAILRGAFRRTHAHEILSFIATKGLAASRGGRCGVCARRACRPGVGGSVNVFSIGRIPARGEEAKRTRKRVSSGRRTPAASIAGDRPAFSGARHPRRSHPGGCC